MLYVVKLNLLRYSKSLQRKPFWVTSGKLMFYFDPTCDSESNQGLSESNHIWRKMLQGELFGISTEHWRTLYLNPAKAKQKAIKGQWWICCDWGWTDGFQHKLEPAILLTWKLHLSAMEAANWAELDSSFLKTKTFMDDICLMKSSHFPNAHIHPIAVYLVYTAPGGAFLGSKTLFIVKTKH